MKFTRLKTTAMAGIMAASMVMPGMTAMAANVKTTPTVDKTVKAAQGVTIPDQDIEFTAEWVGNADGYAKPTGAPDELTVAVANFKDEKGNGADLSSTKNLTISGIPTAVGEYTYKITEDSLPALSDDGYGWSAQEDTTNGYYTEYYLHILVYQGGTEYFVTTTNSKDDVQTQEDGSKVLNNKVDKIQFLNKYTKRGGSSDGDDAPSLTIKKTVEQGTLTKADQKYTFTVSFTANNLNPTKAYSYVIKNASDEQQGTGTITADNATLELQDGWYAEFADVPAGTTVTVTEGYVTNIEAVKANVVSDGENKGDTTFSTPSTTALTVADVLVGEGENTIAYTNTYKNVTITGVATNVAPYVTLVVVAFVAVAAYVVLKRRVAR